MTRRAKITAGVAGIAAAALAVPFACQGPDVAGGPLPGPLRGLTQGTGHIDAFVGSTPTPAGGTITCNQTATNSTTLATAITNASNGNTICLSTGSYGSFTGTSKTVTILNQAASGARVATTPTMTVSLGTGDSGFTLDGMTGMGGDIGGSASSITIQNSTFDGNITITGPSISAILLDHNTHTYDPTGDSGNAKINIESPSGTIASPDVTISNSEVANGDFDGIHFGGDNSSGVVVQDNYLHDLCDIGVNHTDNIQWDNIDPGATEFLVRRNYVVETCGIQGITSYDAGTGSVRIEDNVCDISTRGSCVEIYGDNNGGSGGSTIRHNTVVYHPTGNCLADGGEGCGHIEMNIKPADVGGTTGTGTHVYDNIATAVQFSNGVTGTTDHNMCRISTCSGTGSLTSATPTFSGGSAPTTYAGFCLTSGSTGHLAASDSLDMGIRC